MRREFHVRFCEGLGGKFPRATRLVMGFAREEDARRVMAVLPKRFEKYGLKLHPEKTRLFPFHKPGTDAEDGPRDKAVPETFDLLGFTHYWARSLKGYWVIKQKTARGRLTRALKRISEWCQKNRHRPLAEQQQQLNLKLRGHYSFSSRRVNSLLSFRSPSTVARFRVFGCKRLPHKLSCFARAS